MDRGYSIGLKSVNIVFLSCIFFIQIISCSRTAETVNVISTEESGLQFGSAPIFSVDTLNLSDSHPLSSIDKVVISDTLLYLSSPEGLFCYNLSGNFLRQISARGRASNEWIRLNTFFVTNEGNVCIVDSASGKLIYYDSEGRYLESVVLDNQALYEANNAAQLDDGRILVSHNLIKDNSSLLTLISSDKRTYRNNLLNTFLKSGDVSIPTGQNPFSVFGNSVKCVAPLDNTVYAMVDEEIKELLVINDTGKRLTKKEVVRSGNYSLEKSFVLKSKGYDIGYNSIIETEGYIILSYYNLEYLVIDKERFNGVKYRMTPENKLFNMKLLSAWNGKIIATVNNPFLDTKPNILIITIK